MNLGATNIINGLETHSGPAYPAWRESKLARAALPKVDPISLSSLENPTFDERREIVKRCVNDNMALYTLGDFAITEDETRAGLRAFAGVFGLELAETHRSAGEDGIVALRVSDEKGKAGYIPYSRRGMNWHTDGYYNALKDKVRAFALHCAVPANDGGVNQFLDPEIAYIRLMDENPDFVAALSHPEAMTIPENNTESSECRPPSIGPVFSTDPETGAIEMRYTSRTRSIFWRDDAVLKRAVDCLNDILASDEPYIRTIRLKAGQGILCNNVLHNRTSFDGDNAGTSARVMFRVRFHNSIPGDL